MRPLGATFFLRGRVSPSRATLRRAAVIGRASAAGSAPLAPLRLRATTTGEPSWHRRLRRQRQAARALVAVDTARARLARHHGGGGYNDLMGARGRSNANGGAAGGGGGGGCDARLETVVAQAVVAAMRAANMAGGGGGGRGGANGSGGGGDRGRSRERRGGNRNTNLHNQHDIGRGRSGGGGGNATAAEHREGDWGCGGCNFFPNFAHRVRCYKCGLARGPGRAGGAAATARAGGGGGGGGAANFRAGGGDGLEAAPTVRLGASRLTQVGPPAGGLRPSGAAAAGAAAKPPAASYAAAAAASLGKAGPVGAGGSRPALAWPSMRQPSVLEAARAAAASPEVAARPDKPRPPVDGDGFTTVGRFRRPAATSAAAAESAPATVADPGEDAMEGLDQQGGEGQTPEGGHRGPGGDDQELAAEGDADQSSAAADPEHLRVLWEQEKEVVALLRRQGRGEDDDGLRAAEARCEQARAAWEGVRSPPRLSHRLRRAENALYRARKAKEASEQALADLHEKYREDRAKLSEQWEECVDRFEKREKELASLHKELAAQAHESEAPPPPAVGDKAMLEVAQGVDAVAPILQAVLEAMPEGTKGHDDLATAIAKLAGVSDVAERAVAGKAGAAVCRFRIHGGRRRGSWADAAMDEDSSDFENLDGWTQEEDELGAGHGPGGGAAAAADGGGCEPWAWQQPWGQHGGWAGQGWQGAEGQPGEGGWAWHHGQQYPPSQQDTANGHGAVDTGCEPECADEGERERARRAYALQQAAIAQQSHPQSAGFASAEATAAAAQVHRDRLAEIKSAAASNGIACDDAAMEAFSPQELEQWAKAHLR